MTDRGAASVTGWACGSVSCDRRGPPRRPPEILADLARVHSIPSRQGQCAASRCHQMRQDGVANEASVIAAWTAARTDLAKSAVSSIQPPNRSARSSIAA